MRNKKYLTIVALCTGLATSIFMAIFDNIKPYISENLSSLKWVFIGVGSGLISSAVSIIVIKKTYKDNPELEKQSKINKNDERYIQIRNTSAYYMWFITLFVLIIMSFIFLIFNLYIATCVSLGALAIHIILYIVFLFKLNKTM